MSADDAVVNLMQVNNVTERGSKSSKNSNDHLKINIPCSCKKACFNRINAERMLAIHQQYWNMSYNEQEYWNMSYDEQRHHLYQGISCKQIARRRSKNKDSPKIMKSMNRQY